MLGRLASAPDDGQWGVALDRSAVRTLSVGWAGPACDKLECPQIAVDGYIKDCSGHGRCRSMREAAKECVAVTISLAAEEASLRTEMQSGGCRFGPWLQGVAASLVAKEPSPRAETRSRQRRCGPNAAAG